MNAILEALAEHARLRAGAPAVSSGGKVLTYGDLAENVLDARTRLTPHCVAGRPVALSVINGAAWVVLDLALQAIGAVTIPLPTFFTASQRNHALKEAGASVLIADSPESHCLRSETMLLNEAALYIHELDNSPVRLPVRTAKITYTSGTTGAPKGVCLSHAGIEDVARSLVSTIGSEYAGVHCAVLPLAILLENVAGLYTTLLCGGCYYVPPPAELGLANPFAPDFLKLVTTLEASGATSTIMVPELLRGTMAALVASGMRLPNMKLLAVGGAKVAASLIAQAKVLGLPVCQGYGLSEAASVVTLNTPSDNHPGTVGRPLSHSSISIKSDGEIVLNNPPFLGYVGQISGPKSYPTGDIGQIDAEGYLTIAGRKSDVLITSYGRNISPEWVESELLAQSGILQAFVFGEGQPGLAALIVPISGHVPDSTIQRAVDAANRALPVYARVREWRKVPRFTVDSGELSATGKLRRNTIAENHKAVIEACFNAPAVEFSFFDRLIAATESERGYLIATPQIRDGLLGRISKDTYRQYLGEAYHHVKHTVPLLSLARNNLPPAKHWFREVFDSYIEEERGHEAWILDDIAHVGGDADAVRTGVPRLETELMVAYAYDYVNRINPVGFFGMVFVLEGTSTKLATVGAQALMRSLSLPETCFRYLTSHGALDIAHMQFFEKLMNRITDTDDQAAIIHMAKAMYVLFANMFRAIPHQTAASNAA